MITQESTAKEILDQLEKQLAENKVKDSVHKINLMTTRDMIKELVGSK